MKKFIFKTTTAIKMFFWAFKHTDVMQQSNMNMLSGLYSMILVVMKENRPFMSKLAVVLPDEETKPLISIWAGPSNEADPTKRIEELVTENQYLKRRLINKEHLLDPDNQKELEKIKELEETLTIPDIRNKLSPITHLISMLEAEQIELAKKSMNQAKKSVNYLAKREVYPNENLN